MDTPVLSFAQPRTISNITVVGLGVLGSHLLGHLLRLPGLVRITLVDPDDYELGNLEAQLFPAGGVGRPKAEVQAEAARRLRPELVVVALPERLETVPLGLLDGAMILSCVDNRATRREINRVATRLGIPWVDAGVKADEWLARVTVYTPGHTEACYVCDWSPSDFEASLGVNSCQRGMEAAPTRAPSSLGALTSALQAVECTRLLTPTTESNGNVGGRDVIYDTQNHAALSSRLTHNPDCAFDHRSWEIVPLRRRARQIRLGDLPSLAARTMENPSHVALALEGFTFAPLLHCGQCGHVEEVLGLSQRLSSTPCECGGEFIAHGFELEDELAVHPTDSPEFLQRPLSSLGLRDGDVFTIRAVDAEVHFQIRKES